MIAEPPEPWAKTETRPKAPAKTRARTRPQTRDKTPQPKRQKAQKPQKQEKAQKEEKAWGHCNGPGCGKPLTGNKANGDYFRQKIESLKQLFYYCPECHHKENLVVPLPELHT